MYVTRLTNVYVAWRYRCLVSTENIVLVIPPGLGTQCRRNISSDDDSYLYGPERFQNEANDPFR